MDFYFYYKWKIFASMLVADMSHSWEINLGCKEKFKLNPARPFWAAFLIYCKEKITTFLNFIVFV